MKNHTQYILFCLLALIMQPLYAGSYKCWTNEDGITECGNYVPPQYSQKGFNEFNKEGIRVKEVDRAPTPEEIADLKKKEEEERLLKKRAAENQALLDLFGSEQDIERQRAAVLNTIDGQIHSIKTIISSLENNLEDLKINLEQSLENPEISENQKDTVKGNIESVKQRIQDSKDTLQSKYDEKAKIGKEYDDYLERFRNIKRRGGVPSKEKQEEETAPEASVEKPATQ